MHPKIGKVIIAGGGIYMMIARLKKIYLELIKSKMLNFKMIELYLSFFTCFVNENIIDKETICRLMKLQKRMHFEEIS